MRRRVAAGAVAAVLPITTLAGACGGDGEHTTPGLEPVVTEPSGADTSDTDAAGGEAGSGTAGTVAADPGVRVVAVGEAARIHAARDRLVIDVRTPEEFAEGHVEGATNIDISSADFADRIAELDPDGRYLIYCRTANRSAGARQLMDELGFRDVVDIDGGTVAWAAAGLPLHR